MSNWQDLASTHSLQALCEMAVRSIELQAQVRKLQAELAELKSQHKEAVDRIKDLLLGDDGQACKEAERYLDKQKKILTQAKGTDNASR